MVHLVADVQAFQRQFLIAEDGPGVTRHFLELLATVLCTEKQVHDANIVATRRNYGIQHLLTHNVTDFNRLAAHITIKPFIP